MDAADHPVALVEIDEASFEREVLRAVVPTLVAFGTAWSEPCQAMRTTLLDIQAERPGRVRVVVVSVDRCPVLSVWYGIMSIPTLLWFVEGKVRGAVVGTTDKVTIWAKLEPPGGDAAAAP